MPRTVASILVCALLCACAGNTAIVTTKTQGEIAGELVSRTDTHLVINEHKEDGATTPTPTPRTIPLQDIIDIDHPGSVSATAGVTLLVFGSVLMVAGIAFLIADGGGEGTREEDKGPEGGLAGMTLSLPFLVGGGFLTADGFSSLRTSQGIANGTLSASIQPLVSPQNAGLALVLRWP